VKSGRNLLEACFLLVFCFAYFFTLKMEAVPSSEKSVDDFHMAL
jgi:hypothetical protein